MHVFTIKDMENLSGIKAHTLRMWEQRYQLLVPKRKTSNHRLYNNEDLKQLLRIAFLYRNGLKISHIAGLQEDARKKMALHQAGQKPKDSFLNQLLEAAIDFNMLQFEELLSQSVAQLGIEQCVTSIIYPYLEKIGLLWLTDNAIPAQEHFSSNIIRSQLLLAIDALPPASSRKLCLLFTPPGEFHEIPLLFFHYLLRKNGTRVWYAGANCTMPVLKQVCENNRVSHLVFYHITPTALPDQDAFVYLLCQQFNQQQVIAAGPANAQLTSRAANLTILNSLHAELFFARQAE